MSDATESRRPPTHADSPGPRTTWAHPNRRGRLATYRRRSVGALVAGVLAVGGLAGAASTASGAQVASANASTVGADDHTSSLTRDLRGNLESYLRARGTAEHASAVGLSVSLPGARSTIDVSAGTTQFGGSRPLSASNQWQIGSNTKAFTSTLLLQLEAERRLSVDDTVGKWLPQYAQWRNVTIRRLLNMTSGIPTYDEQPQFMADYAANPYRYFSKEELISYTITAPPTTGYSYSNTGYLLAEMIIEKATRDSYQHQLYTRIIGPLHLDDTEYRPHLYPRWVMSRVTAGYFFVKGLPPLAGLVGRDVSRHTVSWAQGAGGIISTLHDMTVWERAMYSGAVLPPAQQVELMSLVSTRTGQPIDHTSPAEPSGFGLGVQQGTTTKFGTFWVYLGGTLGFRTLHVYLPDSGVIMAMGINSQPSEDAINSLATSIYDTLHSHGLIRPKAGSQTAGRR